VPEGTDHVVCSHYMAHHSGMSIAAVAGSHLRSPARRSLGSGVGVADLLLQARTPRDHPDATVRTEADEAVEGRKPKSEPGHAPSCSIRKGAAFDQCHVQRTYSVMVTATGSGTAAWGRSAGHDDGSPTRPRTALVLHLPAQSRHR